MRTLRPLTHRAATAAAWASALLLAAAAPAAAQRTAPPDARTQTVELNRPGVRSYYAFVESRTRARTRPSRTARAVADIRTRTGDGTDELVLVLARYVRTDGRVWFKVRLTALPNNQTAWVPKAALSSLQPVHTWLRIDTRRLRASLVDHGRVVFRARIGVGQRQWPTPLGEFYVRYRLTGYGAAGSFYGPIAFATSARSETLTDWPGGGVVGIHGTSLPGLLPGRVSHGCVRMRNPDILRLARRMPVGTPVTIV